MKDLSPLQKDILVLMKSQDWIDGVIIDNYQRKTMSGTRQLRKMKPLGYTYEKRLKPGSRHHHQYRLTGEPCRFVNNQACFA